MKIVKKNVYYCDHCKKRSLSKHHLFIHECHCTNNPDRNCRMCNTPNRVSLLIPAFKARFILKPSIESYEGIDYGETLKAEWTGKPVTLQEIRDSVDSCPNCMLAIIRQCKFAYHYFEEEAGFKNFDYKSEFNVAMIDKRSELEKEENYY